MANEAVVGGALECGTHVGGIAADSLAPRRVGELAFRSVDAGGWDRACGITWAGEAQCWTAQELLP